MCAIALHILLGIDLPKSVKLAIESHPDRILPYPVFWTLQGFGFLIGFFTARDIRRASHTTIITEAAGGDEHTEATAAKLERSAAAKAAA